MKTVDQELFTQTVFHKKTQEFIDRYYECTLQINNFKPRSKKLFVWSYEGSRQMVLDSVPNEMREKLYNINVIAILLNVMIDDIADMISDAALLEKSLDILEKGGEEDLSLGDFREFKPYFSLMIDLRSYIHDTIRSWPQYVLWISDLAYFLKRLSVAMKNSLIFNQALHKNNEKIFAWSFDEYLVEMAPPIHVFIYGIFNLMLIKDVEYSEREMIVKALLEGEQFMVMSNWLSTWEVEIESKDFTSGVVLWALDNNIVTKKELSEESGYFLKNKIRASFCEQDFEQKMHEKVSVLENFDRKIKTFSLSDYIENLHRVHNLHMNHNQMLKY